jgi:hypothetical protein
MRPLGKLRDHVGIVGLEVAVAESRQLSARIARIKHQQKRIFRTPKERHVEAPCLGRAYPRHLENAATLSKLKQPQLNFDRVCDAALLLSLASRLKQNWLKIELLVIRRSVEVAQENVHVWIALAPDYDCALLLCHSPSLLLNLALAGHRRDTSGFPALGRSLKILRQDLVYNAANWNTALPRQLRRLCNHRRPHRRRQGESPICYRLGHSFTS